MEQFHARPIPDPQREHPTNIDFAPDKGSEPNDRRFRPLKRDECVNRFPDICMLEEKLTTNCLATIEGGGGRMSFTEIFDRKSRIALALLTLLEFCSS